MGFQGEEYGQWIVLQIFCIAFITFTQPYSLSSRKMTGPSSNDPYIICDNEGPMHSEGLPLVYNEYIYAELLTLCSSAHGASQNMGCFCSTSHGHVHCDPNLADQGLWEASYSPEDDDVIQLFADMGLPGGHMTFQQLCENGCECENTTEARNWFRKHFDGEYDWRIFTGFEGMIQPEKRPGNNGFAAGSLIGNAPLADSSRWQNQCGNNCTSAKDCSAPVGSNDTCTCQAHSSQYQPGSGTVAFIAACMVTLGSGGNGKRDEALLPCPCNSTYVSHGCCDAIDGVVWEPPELRLGSLVIGTGL